VWAGVDNAWEQEKPEARKMLVKRAESHTSGARFVGRHVVQDSLAVKEPACIKPDKLLHELLTFTTDKNHDLPKCRITKDENKCADFRNLTSLYLLLFYIVKFSKHISQYCFCNLPKQTYSFRT
jgi:hypothetical protein